MTIGSITNAAHLPSSISIMFQLDHSIIIDPLTGGDIIKYKRRPSNSFFFFLIYIINPNSALQEITYN
jgi:hypothetical protein